jgi:superfamily II DNA/RNA helicase
LSPTRELSLQTAQAIKSIGKDMDAEVHSCVGGTSVKEDIRMLNRGPHVVVGTPGRVKDMISKGYFKTFDIKLVVIDEADEIKEETEEILNKFKEGVQMAVFSVFKPRTFLR